MDKADRVKLLQLQNRLYYITNKDQVNINRKKYKRQSWSERADNPKNKAVKNE